MGTKHFRSLVLGVAAASVFASAVPSSEAVPIPFFGKSVCKEEKERLHHEQNILRDRQRLALDQCRAGAGAGKNRCEDMERQQKAETNRFKDRKKLALDDCKQRGGQKRADKHD